MIFFASVLLTLRLCARKSEIKFWHPFAYASRTLNESEQNFCQLEKEILPIVFGCVKFHDYIYGSIVNLFMCTMIIFNSNQYLPNLLSNHAHTFKL